MGLRYGIYHPDLCVTLISVSQLCREDFTVIFKDKEDKIIFNDGRIVHIKRDKVSNLPICLLKMDDKFKPESYREVGWDEAN